MIEIGDKADSNMSSLWPRVVSISAVILMIIQVLSNNMNCAPTWIYTYAGYASLLLNAIGVFAVNKDIEIFVLNLFRNSLAASWEFLIYYLGSEHFRSIPLALILPCISGSLAIIVCIFYITKKC